MGSNVKNELTRRTFVASSAAAALGAALWPGAGLAASMEGFLTKPIPSSGERIPVIGMGTWITFNVGDDEELRAARTKVLAKFFELGGTLVDSSPMYGSAQEVVGHAVAKLGGAPNLFAADKIWTRDGDETREQYRETASHWRRPGLELMQVHNLVAWEGHLPTLLEMKKAGTIRYVGVTTSHGRRHGDLAAIMKAQPLDFVQLTYNLDDREVERALLPIAKDRGIAVIANRPFQGGRLVDRFQDAGKKLPGYAKEFGITNWPQFLLKFVVSHPAVTCAIPATSQVEHMVENMGACRGELPDAATRKRMLAEL